MKNLKRYDVKAAYGGPIKIIENDTGWFYKADEVDAREESRKLTVEELREKFEKRCLRADETGLHIMRGPDGNYLDETAKFLWQLHLSLARDFDALKDGE